MRPDSRGILALLFELLLIIVGGALIYQVRIVAPWATPILLLLWAFFCVIVIYFEVFTPRSWRTPRRRR